MKRLISVAKAKPYFDILDQYFGMPYPGLADILINLELNPDEDFDLRLTEFVSGNAIQEALDKGRFDTSKVAIDLPSLLWLMCNLYYGDEYPSLMEDLDNTPDDQMFKTYQSVRTVALKSSSLFENYAHRRDGIIARKFAFEKEWRVRTAGQWKKRREELRKKFEKEWGEEAVNGPDWKYVEEEIRKELDSAIEKEIMKALHEEEEWKQLDSEDKDAEKVIIKIGDNKVILEGAGWVVDSLFRNHLFPHFIPGIKKAEQVQEAKGKNKKTGNKPEDNRITAVVHGISKYFYENGLIQNKTQDNLKEFIRSIIVLMGLTNKKGKVPTTAQIQKLIENLPNAKNDPMFYSATFKPIDPKKRHLDMPDPEDELNWLIHPSKQ